MKSGIQKVLTSMRKYLFFFSVYFSFEKLCVYFSRHSEFGWFSYFRFILILFLLTPYSSAPHSSLFTPFHKQKNKINVNVKWRCCFYTIAYKSFAFAHKIVFKTVKNFVDGKPVFFFRLQHWFRVQFTCRIDVNKKLLEIALYFIQSVEGDFVATLGSARGTTIEPGMHTYKYTKYTSTGVQ